MRQARAAATYFLLTYAAGFLFGSLRAFVLEPRFGPLVATLCEAPLMLLAIAGSARWTTTRFALPAGRPRIAMGAIALLLLIAAELFGSALLRSMTPAAYLSHLTTPEGLISLVLFGLFAVMPTWVRPSRGR